MTPKAITSALPAAQLLFLPIDGQPSDNNLIHLSDAILPILSRPPMTASTVSTTYGDLIASVDCYLHHYGAPYIHPATHPTCYDTAINAEASRVDRICTETTWAALLQDYEAYKAAERSINVFIEAVVNVT